MAGPDASGSRPTYKAPTQTAIAQQNTPGLIVTGSTWDQYRGLVSFDLRNGGVEEVTSLLIKPTIGEAFHWVPIADLAPEDAILAIDGFIKSHIRHLATKPPANMSAAVMRKVAIVLGTIRAVSTAYYRLTEADFIPGEIAKPYLAARRSGETTIDYVLAQDVTTHEDLTARLDLSVSEQAAISALVQCGVGVIPMQGYSLIMTGHHYLSDGVNQSKKCFQVAETAYWRGQALGTFFSDHLTDLQDAAWHKSCHPVMISLKHQMAMNETLPAKLKAAHAGACASRLPAAESDMRAANSYLTCIRTVAQLIEMMEGSVDFTVLEEAVAAVSWFPVNGAASELKGLDSVPRSVVDRPSALRWLANVLERSQTTAAYCYGFYCAMVDQNQTLNTENDGLSLKTSNSLTKLKNNCYPNWVVGTQFYGDYVSARNTMRTAGNILPPKLVIK